MLKIDERINEGFADRYGITAYEFLNQFPRETQLAIFDMMELEGSIKAEAAHDEGYEAGYDDGHADGWESGNDEGWRQAEHKCEESYEKGYRAALQEAQDAILHIKR